VEITQEQIQLLIANKVIPASADKSQIAYFFEVCKRKHLDPFLKYVHMIERNERDPKHEGQWLKSYTIQTSLDGMRAIAQRNVKVTNYRRTVRKADGETYGCCEIATADRGTYYDECPLSEYIGRTKTGEITKFWKQFPQTMIKKVAEESVLRMLCPEDLSDIYGDDEMDQAENNKRLPEEKEIKQIPLVAHVNEILDDSIPVETIPEPLPQTQAQGASFNQFDPRTEIMNFGKKHNGVEWIKVPSDYLVWMQEKCTSAEFQQKAKITLEFKKQVATQIPDPMDGVFGKKEELAPDELTPIEQLQDSLDKATRQGTIEALEGWANIFKSDLEKLSETEKAEMRKAYNAAKKQVKGK
jgi:phage recombination protein Bet